MCRFLAYFARENSPQDQSGTTLEGLLFKTSNSLVKQSRHAKMRHEPTNGDGFGIGWYPLHDDPEPGTFVSIEPAWSNRNLKQLASKVRARQFFAHVRDASPGMPVSQSNCHPFQFGRFLWMHNGHLKDFEKIRRNLLNTLSDKAFEFVDGNTDSEHAFALFLDQAEGQDIQTIDDLEKVLLATMTQLTALRKTHHQDTNADMNFAASNGMLSAFTRYCSRADCDPPSLHYCESEHDVIVASEPLTDSTDWQEVERNYLLLIDQSGSATLRAISNI